jgi:hypothetical protein
MKFNKLLITLLIVGMLSCCLTAVFAEEGTLPDGTTVSIPDGFSVLETDTGLFTLVTEDQKSVIGIQNQEIITDLEKAKQAQIENGATFVSDQSVDIAGIEVAEQKFTKQGLNMAGYLFTINDTQYVITYTTPDETDINDESNPVREIITGLAGGEETSE